MTLSFLCKDWRGLYLTVAACGVFLSCLLFFLLLIKGKDSKSCLLSMACSSNGTHLAHLGAEARSRIGKGPLLAYPEC